MHRLFIIFFFVSFLSKGVLAQDLKFSMPLKGVPTKDYFIGFYVDHDPTDGWKDVNCGGITYNGHRGTDFFLRSFKTMDSGVYVYAVADGVVFSIRDGNFDRNKNLIDANLNRSNYIGINHGDKYYVYYHHLMNHSLLVRVGDSVKRGQAIGKVGASGYASNPHLHFEVWNIEENHLVDPFSGKCEQGVQSIWNSESPYDSSVYAIDNGFVPYVPNPDALKERYLVKDTFDSNEDNLVCFWVQLHGIHPGDLNRVEWHNPKGRIIKTTDYVWPASDAIWKGGGWWNYTWHWFNMPNINGAYIAKFYVNRKFIVSRGFYVTKRTLNRY